MRWKEPRAFAATDHTARRPHAEGVRLRQRVRGQCGGRCKPGGRLIPHAGAIRALVIPVIEPAFGTGAMPAPRRAEAGMARGRPTRQRAIGVAAVTRGTDREGPAAPAAGFLAKRRVHGVGAAARFDWTRQAPPWHNRDDRLGRVGASRWSTRVWRHQLQALTSFAAGRSVPDAGPRLQPRGLWTLSRLWTHRPRPQPLGNLAAEREISTSVHSPSSS